jgi:hypothetical protein
VFGKKDNNKKALVTAPNIPSKVDFSTEILENMRMNQVISNYEYMMLSLQVQILEKLNSIDVSSKSTAVATGFTGRYVSNKFKWF